MTIENSYIIKLVDAYFNNKDFKESSGNMNWDKLYEAAHFQGIANLTYYALEHFGIKPSPGVARNLFLENEDYVGVEALQELEVQNLISEFEEAEVDCMPMKGHILKNMYPLVDMREMCDTDLLVKEGDYPKIRVIMEENGFSFEGETPHEYVFKKGDMLNIELHKYIVPPYNNILYGYYGDGWKLAKKQAGYEHIYEMNMEDFYVYILVHTAKHYLNSGIGIRQVLDLWVIEQKNPDMDFSYINEQLELLNLMKFKENIKELMGYWFGNGKSDNPTVIEMEDYIMRCGVRGVVRQEKISQIYRNSDNHGEYGEGYRKYLLNAFFPSVEMISLKYPVVKKCVLLYPFCWIHRLVHNLLFQRDKLRNKFAKDGIQNSEVKEFSRHCDAVGLRNDL